MTGLQAQDVVNRAHEAGYFDRRTLVLDPLHGHFAERNARRKRLEDLLGIDIDSDVCDMYFWESKGPVLWTGRPELMIRLWEAFLRRSGDFSFDWAETTLDNRAPISYNLNSEATP